MESARNPVDVYVDESSQTGHRFMAIGAILCGEEAGCDITRAMDQSLRDHGTSLTTEFHWTELNARDLGLYKDVSSKLFGAMLGRRGMRYHALVVDMKAADRELSRGRNREAVLAKLIFKLVFDFAGHTSPAPYYRIWIDKRPQSVHDVEMDRRTLHALNRQAMSVFGCSEGPFASVAFVDSRTSRLIQATDLITGAIAYEANGKHLLTSASKHRVALLEHVIACSSLATLAAASPHRLSGFDIRHMDIAECNAVSGLLDRVESPAITRS